MTARARTGLAALALVALAALPARAVAPAPVGEEEILRRVEAASADRAQAGVDARVLFDGLFAQFRDGKAEVRRQRLARLDTEWSWDELGDPRLAWDRRRQALVVHASRTYLPGGVAIDTPENGFNDVTPDGLDRSVDHLDLREMVVTHVGLEPGAIVFLDWTVRDTVASSRPFDLVVFPHERFPVAERVIVAEGLRGEVVNPPDALFVIPPLREDAGAMVWSGTDLAAAPHPPGERAGDELPWIALSSAATWESALGVVARDVEAAAATREGVAGMLAELEKKEPVLTGRESLATWVKAIGDRTERLDREAWRDLRVPRSVETTLARSMATPLERCAILLACCREKGLESAVVVPARSRTIPRDVPALASLGSPLLRVLDPDGSVWWADPATAEVSAAPPFAPGLSYFLLAGPAVTRDRLPADTSRVEVAVFRDLVAGRAKCEGRITGPAARRLDLTRPESLMEEWMSGWADSADVESARLVEWGPDRLRFAGSAKTPLPAEDDRGRIAVSLPVAPFAVADLLPSPADVAFGRSDHVLFAEAPVRVDVRWHLHVPGDREVLSPVGLAAECPGGKWSVRRVDEGDQLRIEYTLTWDGRAVAPADYPAFRGLLLEVLDERNATLVLGHRQEDAR